MRMSNLGSRKALYLKSLGPEMLGGRRLLSSSSVFALLLSAGLALPDAARAVDWTGATSNDWFMTGNWSTDAVPTAGDTVVISTVTPNPTTVNGGNAFAHVLEVGIVPLTSGVLTISNGGTVSSVQGYLGFNSGSTGTVAVTGAGSTWSSSLALVIGNSGTGALTIANGGAVSSNFGAIGSTATGTGTVVVDGAGSSWTNSGALLVGDSGTGTLTIANGGAVSSNLGAIGSDTTGTGTVVVDGANSAWINSGNLNVGELGAGRLTISNGGKVSNAFAIIGHAAGASGTVVVDGAGSTWANSEDLYVGWSGVGALTVSNGGKVSNKFGVIGVQVGSIGAVVVDGAASSWTNSSNISVGGFGSGTLTISNGGTVSNAFAIVGQGGGASGTVVVDGAGSTWANSGDLSIGLNGVGALTISNGGKVTSNFGDLAVGSGSIGNASVSGAGSTWINTTNFIVGHSGTGVLTVTAGGVVSNVDGTVGHNASSAGIVTVSGAGSSWTNSGNLTVGNIGTGTLNISNRGVVSVSGVATIAAQAGSTGTLNIGGAAGSAATVAGTLNASNIQFGLGTGTINFNHTSSSYLFSADVVGNGAVSQLSGTTILTGSSTYTGPTTVDGGTLLVNGSIASSTTVNAGGTLGGIGVVGDTTIGSGTLAPGNPNATGTLTIAGNLVLTTAATYMVEVSGTSASKTVVTGAAQLAGTLVVNMTGRLSTTTTYVILSSANTTGGFDSISISNQAYARNARVSLAANGDELLTLDAGFLSPTLPGFANINQKNVAAAIDNGLLAGGSMTTGFNKLFGATGQNLLNGLTQASGEAATGAQQGTFSAMGQFLNTLLDPFLGGRNDTAAPASGASRYADEGAGARTNAARDAYAAIDQKARGESFTQRWNVWAAGYGGSQTTDGNAVIGSNTATSRIAGVAAGADYQMSPNTLVGFALGGGGTSFGVANGLGSGSSDLFQAGVYARHTMGNAYVAGALAYGWQDVTTDRTVTIAGADHLRAKFNANALSGRLEGGYRYVTPWMGITPYAAAQFTSLYLPSYGEQAVTGANTFALNYAGRDVTATRSELGLRTDRSYALETAILTLRGRAAWAHDFNPDRAISATFQTLPGASFVVNGAASAHDAALVTGAAELKWLNGVSLSGTFEGEFSNVTRSYAGKGIARYQW